MAIYSDSLEEQGLSHPLYVRQWLPKGEIFGLVQLCHGMAEHGERYMRLGEYLAEHGYAAFCHDHRGHGKTCLSGETLGYFADKDGWDKVVDDTIAIGELKRREYPDGPFIMFGHSMGSLVASSVAALGVPTLYNGYILCGSPSPNPLVELGKSLATVFCRAGLAKKPNTALHAMAFADVQKLFRHEKSKNAWISSDSHKVEEYDKDPLCGFRFTSKGFYDMFDGLSRVRCRDWALKTECKPFLVISGENDPIGGVRAVKWVEENLRHEGREVRSILYPHKRHEILNEQDCDKVYTDIMTWIWEIEANE